ncbi:pathogenesis-related protein 1-like [Alnus glutinosa]|uniref:pathogenesis-related protein 1-like n=1 Tax=Alnus glutinosa TaxID=3517 RepID=UPI002D775F40|nr:pathogenesis-related protein 1-like [Alnus glutinosa]
MHELNQARVEVGVPPLIWNVSLEAYARNNANKRVSDCKLVYFHGPYGECIAKSYGGGNSADAVRLWIAERVFYNHESNNYSSECRSYTQVVWRNTKYLGCATMVGPLSLAVLIPPEIRRARVPTRSWIGF